MPGSCGALPGYAIKISRESRGPHELFRVVHDDPRRTKKEGPLLHGAGTSYHCGKRANGETAERTSRFDSAGGVPAAAWREWSVTTSPGESHKDDNVAEAKHRSVFPLGSCVVVFSSSWWCWFLVPPFWSCYSHCSSPWCSLASSFGWCCLPPSLLCVVLTSSASMGGVVVSFFFSLVWGSILQRN